MMTGLPRRGAVSVRALASLVVCCAVFFGAATARAQTAEGITVNDVTQINPIRVRDVVVPTTLTEIVEAVKKHAGPISIGGGRYSMGGQTATENALQIDMRQFDKVIDFSKERKEITVQSGITWRKIQEFIDPHELSLQIMQSYANFTVGGSLSVNVHGRYIGQGPIVMSVKAIRVVLPDGSLVRASPRERPEVFYGAIGGYGALGVIAEATLALADNVKVERHSIVMPLRDYKAHFIREVRDNPGIIFHNADIYPSAYDTVRVTSYVHSEKPVTIVDRLRPTDAGYLRERAALWAVSALSFGNWLRRRVLDPWVYREAQVVWRNYEASYDVRELEPGSRKEATYVLQEYFVPIDALDAFALRMAETLRRHDVNTINVSIRHAKKDPGTLLAWARTEVFAFVLFYKQGTTDADRRAVGVWTRELIDAVRAVGGTYYLPYQIHATARQFRAAYPGAAKFFALKKRLDPTNKFRNKLWDAYYEDGRRRATSNFAAASIATELERFPGYKRDEAQTYLTVPEWYLVYSPGEYAKFVQQHSPADFPYFGAIGQFWNYYRSAYRVTKAERGFNVGYHVMVAVIGSSFTVENLVKGVYENVFGRLTWWLTGAATEEDRFAARVAQEYVDFIHVTPWYEFPFARRVKQLWVETDWFGPGLIRKWERKLALSIEYLAKAQYATLIKLATKAAYGNADTEMLALAEGVGAATLQGEPTIKVLRRFDDDVALLAFPRYEEFREVTERVTRKGLRFREIAGNDDILLTAVVPASWRYGLSAGEVAFANPVLTSPDQSLQRVAIKAPVAALHRILGELRAQGFAAEHIYDY